MCNSINGSGRSFYFDGCSMQDSKVVDGFANTEHVFLDAFNYKSNSADQYTMYFLFRELDKVLSAITPLASEKLPLIPFSTGAWGCGVFGVG
jgi:Poly (ADP-ribose) glycohydrolase (PARG)